MAAVGDESVEQLVLAELEPTDLSDHVVAVTPHGPGLPVGTTVLAFGQGRFGHQGPHTGVAGLVDQVGQLFIGPGQIGAQTAQAGADLVQAPLDPTSVRRPSGRSCTFRPRRAGR